MKFGKLIDGELELAPNPLKGVELTFIDEGTGEPVTGLYTVGNPTAEQYASKGYLPVYEDMPAEPAGEGYHWEPRDYDEGVDDDGNPAIILYWTKVEDPDPDTLEIDADEALRIIFGGDEND